MTPKIFAPQYDVSAIDVPDSEEATAILAENSEAHLASFIAGGANNQPAPTATSTRGANRQTFDSAAQQIIEHGRGLRSVKAPLTQLRIEGDHLVTDEGAFLLGSEGMRRLAGDLKAPADYLATLPLALRNDCLNHHLHHASSPRDNRLYHRDGAFVGLGRFDLYTLDSAQVLGAVKDGFDTLDFEVERLEIAHEQFSADLVSPSVAVEARRGDILQAGVRVEHSYTGDRATTVFAFVTRLVCTNGMVHRECLGARRTSRTRRLNADREDAGMLQYDQIKRLAADARRQIGPSLEAITKLAGKRADETQLRLFLGQARMNSQALVQQLRAAWAEEENERTAFGLFNALTRLATHGTDLSARQRGALARLAGVYANSSNHLCPHCFSVLNQPHRPEASAID